jgi:hypothetical protein
MRKSTLFISAVLTTFMLAVLFGVVSAYQQMVTTPQPEVAATLPATEVQTAEQLMSVAPTQIGVVTPEQATTLAMQMVGRMDVYSVESTEYEGAAAYLVTFTSGDLVYVSPTGQILAVTELAPVVVWEPAHKNKDKDRNVEVVISGGGDEDHDDHDDGDDDD